MVWKKAVVTEFDALPQDMTGRIEETMKHFRHTTRSTSQDLLNTKASSRLGRKVLWGVGDGKKKNERIRNQHNEKYQEIKTCRLYE
jgi:hypothetical protein